MGNHEPARVYLSLEPVDQFENKWRVSFKISNQSFDLSYCAEDVLGATWMAEQLAKALKKAGASVVIDKPLLQRSEES